MSRMLTLLTSLALLVGPELRPFLSAELIGQTVSAPPDSIVGLWQATKYLGPEVRGRLIVDHPAWGWRASIAGRSAMARLSGDTLSFDLPDSSGSYVGHLDVRRGRVIGQWIQNGSATPLLLENCGANCYGANVVPVDQGYTFYLKVTRRADGSLGAFLRNPERNLGRFFPIDHIVADSGRLRFVDKKGALVFDGLLHDNVITVFIGNRGGSYDFSRVPEGSFTYFYPRGHPIATYTYVPPRPERDGWPVGRMRDVGISEGKIADFIQTLVNNPVDSLGALYLHGLLIARHGKLVLEEYFYGENGEKPHDTRSAAKSVLSVMIGAAMQSGVKITPETRVYSVMRPDAKNLEPRKQRLTVENLLNMASGLDCDDNGDEDRPGNEDNLVWGPNKDWYGAILDLKTIRDPGDTAVYCSINPHLAGGVLARVAKRSLPDLMWGLLGEPLQMRNYFMNLSPRREAYMGGGMQFRPRDFMKLGQLYLNNGTWNGRRIVSQEWIKRSTIPRYPIYPPQKYGYLWWMTEYAYEGRTLQAYFASGNGGNEVIVIPDLDLVIATYGANYNERAGWDMVLRLIPRYVLPAIGRAP